MEKKEILKAYKIEKLDDNTVFVNNNNFMFFYTIADSVVKDEYKGKYRYVGGLQCNFKKDSDNYKLLESWLCEIVEKILKI